jgi:hypothetical protein
MKIVFLTIFTLELILLNNLETNHPIQTPHKTDIISQELTYAGPKIFFDAAWKAQSNGKTPKACLGIYITWQVNSDVMDVFVSAKAANIIASPILAEVAALITATQIASSLILEDPIFFTDNLAAMPGARDPTVLWEIRRQAIQFQELTQPLRVKIIHVGRQLIAT